MHSQKQNRESTERCLKCRVGRKSQVKEKDWSQQVK